MKRVLPIVLLAVLAGHIAWSQTPSLNDRLLEAARKPDPQSVEALLDQGTNVEVKDRHNETPLLLALLDEGDVSTQEAGRTKTVEILLKHGANVNVQDDFGDTPLIRATHKGYLRAAALLLEHGDNIEAKDNRGISPLLGAVIGSEDQGEEIDKKAEMIKFLLDRGASIDSADNRGETALIRAASNDKDSAILELLIQRGANLEAQNRHGKTPLLIAASTGQVKAMSILITSGANIECKDKSGETPLLSAARSECVECTKLLLSKGANTKALDAELRSALHLAMIGDGADMSKDSTGNPEIVNLLIARGIDINARDATGHTSLYYAVQHNRKAILPILKSHGAR